MDNSTHHLPLTPALTGQFNEQGYVLLQNAMPEMLLAVAYRYLLLMAQNQTEIVGDEQVPNTFQIYGDPFMESLLVEIKPVVEQVTHKQLFPTYAYSRVYKQGDTLSPHQDRLTCEISVTLCIGQDIIDIQQDQPEYTWPIFMNGTPILCSPGDMVIYKGCEVEHWREAFEGKQQGQVFLHYVDQDQPYSKYLKFDGRPNLGLPTSTRDLIKLALAEARSGIKSDGD
ncbi:MAG: hypothetical protein AAF629_19210 [Chloroflexota bacterium]